MQNEVRAAQTSAAKTTLVYIGGYTDSSTSARFEVSRGMGIYLFVIDPATGFLIKRKTFNVGNTSPSSLVISPNPFYQIYEGAAYLAGAEPYFVNSDPARNFGCDYDSIPASVWERVSLLFLCSPESDFVVGQNWVVDGGMALQ